MMFALYAVCCDDAGAHRRQGARACRDKRQREENAQVPSHMRLHVGMPRRAPSCFVSMLA